MAPNPWALVVGGIGLFAVVAGVKNAQGNIISMITGKPYSSTTINNSNPAGIPSVAGGSSGLSVGNTSGGSVPFGTTAPDSTPNGVYTPGQGNPANLIPGGTTFGGSTGGYYTGEVPAPFGSTGNPNFTDPKGPNYIAPGSNTGGYSWS